jgi:hypothetical protein
MGKTAAKIGLYDKDTLTEDFAHTKNSVYNYDFDRLNDHNNSNNNNNYNIIKTPSTRIATPPPGVLVEVP